MTTRRRGFTMIELLTVIAIISILVVILVPVVVGIVAKADRKKAEGLILKLQSALEQYYTDFLKYPPGDGGDESSKNLAAYLCNPLVDYSGVPRGPYLSVDDLRSSCTMYSDYPMTTEGTAVVDFTPEGSMTAGKRLVFYIQDGFGAELRYMRLDNAPAVKWSDDNKEWKDTTGTYDLISAGPDMQVYQAQADNNGAGCDDVANYNIK